MRFGVEHLALYFIIISPLEAMREREWNSSLVASLGEITVEISISKDITGSILNSYHAITCSNSTRMQSKRAL